MKAKVFLLILLFIGLNTHLMAQNNALDFDGANDYVEVADDDVFDFTSFTIEAWIYPDDLTAPHTIMGKSNVEWLPASTAFDLETSGTLLYGSVWDASGIQKYIQAGTLTTGLWQHVAMTWTSGGSIILYINGKNVGSQPSTFSGTIANAGSFKIGVYPWVSQYYWNGKIDEVRVWDFVKTEEQIQAGMYQEFTGSESGLVAYYNFNESSGTSLDDVTSNNLNGTLTNMNGNEWSASPAFFGPKYCLDFNGSSHYGTIPANASLQNSNFTVEFWMQMDGTTSTFNGIIDNGRDVSSNWFFLTIANSLAIIFGIGNGSGIAEIWLGVNDNNWHHIAGVYNGTTAYLYFDGVLSGSTNVSLSILSRNIIIAKRDGYEQYFNGKLDELRIWSDVRTEEEIRDNMCKTLEGDEAGLVAYYTFDNYSGSALQDLTSNTNDATLTNSPAWTTSTAFNTWLNTSSSNWSTAANWSRESVPTSTDNVGVHNQSGSDPTIGAAIACNHLVVGSGVDLTFNYSGSHTIHGSVFNIGHTNIYPGNKLTITKSLYMLPLSSLDLEPGGQLSIGHNLYNNILSSPGDFTLESDATGTGSLILTGTVDGSIKAERFLTHDRWHYISDPVNTSGNFDALNLGLGTPGSSSNQFYRWEESYTSGSYTGYWIDILNGADGSGTNTLMDEEGFTDCKGYAVNYVTTDKTITLSGPLHTSNQSINLTKTGGSFEGANLVGNPFSSTIAINTGADATNNFLTQNTAALNDSYEAIYLWDESAGWDGKSNADYDAVANADAAFYASPGQGFMVMAASNGATLNFNTSIRKHGTSAYYKNETESDHPGLRLYASTGEQYNKTEILLVSGMTPGLDPSYDVGKMKGNPELALYTRLIEDNGVDFAIQALPPENIESIVVNVGIDVPEARQIEFAAETMQLESIPLFLEDRQTNTFTNLKNERYTTWVDESGTGRFFLHFKDITGIEDAVMMHPLQVFHYNDIIYILNPDGERGEASVTDISGRELLRFTLTGSHNQQETLGLPSGIYFVSIHMTEKMQVHRVLIN
ncbi:MAG: T9SS type A sorting domain-containing protein [Bacteroidetes bacterium]|nr:T9SS type A sorting domain-containing protein [Bacteroidota bacterium]